MKLIITILLSLTSICSLESYAREIKGFVRDNEGRPIANAVISDGRNTTESDNEGKYVLNVSEESRFVFLSTPSGYLSSVRKQGNKDCFYKEISEAQESYDFCLRKNPMEDKEHNVVVIADPQVLDMEDIELFDGRLQKMQPDIKRFSERYTFGICLGDIVGYDHNLYGPYQEKLDDLGLDFRHVLGNHDMYRENVRTHEGSMERYEDFFGPAWYSFNVGDVHYVVMNNNFYIGRDWFYIGYLDEVQMEWLEKDLSYIPADKKVVVCLHIPTTLSKEDRESFNYPSLASIQANKNPLYSVLEPYDALILSGHIHTCTTQNIREGLTEINVGGMCGAWWCGDVCIDGGPAGYKHISMDGTEARWRYIGCGYPEDYQMKVYANDAAHPGEVIVNVWDYDDKWKVEYFEDGKKVCDMERFQTQDPYALKLFKDPGKYKIPWVGAAKSANFFKATISSGVDEIEIKVTDRFKRIYTETVDL